MQFGKGELELIMRCAFQREGQQAADERRVDFHVLLSSHGEKCTAPLQ